MSYVTESQITQPEGLGHRDDWPGLDGHVVEVWRLGEHVTTGTVEQTSEDGSVLWLAAEGAVTRRLFDKKSGYRMWFAPRGFDPPGSSIDVDLGS